jgi:hypothetical protein
VTGKVCRLRRRNTRSANACSERDRQDSRVADIQLHAVYINLN